MPRYEKFVTYHIAHVSDYLWSIFESTELLRAGYMNLAIKTFRLGDFTARRDIAIPKIKVISRCSDLY